MEKEKINNLIIKRPRAYGWIIPQRLFLWLFILCGGICIINTAIIITIGIIEYSSLEEFSRQVAGSSPSDQQQVMEFLLNWLEPIKYKAILYSIFLSVLFFILARYSQKIINRNRYILKLERAWNSLSVKDSKAGDTTSFPG